MYGNAHPSYPAGFKIHCTNGSVNKQLQGRIDGSLYWDGTMYSANFQISSDKRLKSDIKPIEDPLDKIDKLNGYTFNKVDVDGRTAGLIAQDVESVLPEAIRENNDHYKTVNYSAVIGLLVEAVKQLKAQINNKQ